VRIATWNVNSLKARQDRVEAWLQLRDPDILLMQETKLTDETAPLMAFQMAGYHLTHHGEGRWNGVAIASKQPATEISYGFEGNGPDAEGARFLAARIDGIRTISVYAPNGRALATPFYEAKLDWYERLLDWLSANADPADSLVLGGDLNIAPTDLDVYDPQMYVGTTHTSPPEREAFQRLLDWGLVEAYRTLHPEPGKFTWWDYRAGNFHKGLGMRIDLVLLSTALAAGVTDAYVDRDARKGKLPSDHAPVVVDLELGSAAPAPTASGAAAT
jgi:exodeoxyribonuclease-3